MSQASEALTRANESSRLSFAKYPARQYYRSYRTSIDEGRNLPAKVNPELVEHLTVYGDLWVSFSQGEMMHLEEALLTTQDTQNFLFWLMGTFCSLTSSGEGLSVHGPMLHQLTHSIQHAMVDQARITAFALANDKGSKERLLSLTSSPPAKLRCSHVDSDLLFDLASVEEAIGQARQAASVPLTEVAAKALIKAKPRPGAPLVEKHPRSSTSADSRPCPGPTQQWFSKPYFQPSTSHNSGHPSSRQSYIRTFRK
ncbi:hypothetical protein E2C01_042260 [Portunus trituberculatus]|uniref:Uncharacterized protein n=1 Tax=Portunus trituberculatus TaxID=210409 RepID=A0A5B7FSY7_PORTR|nr:hypothetical protein [Portunus trituberculatus]